MELGLQIRGTGMTNALGLHPRAVELALRAGISRVEQGSFCDLEGDPASLARLAEDDLPPLAAAIAALPGLPPRVLRMVRLAGPALAHALVGAELPAPPIVLLAAPTGCVLPRNFIELLAHQSGVALDLQASRVELGGRAASLELLAYAAKLVGDGYGPPVVIGGVDSQIDLRTLAALSLADRLRTQQQSDGFAPGEGAAFALLGRGRGAGARTGCVLASLGVDREPGVVGSEEPYLGDGLDRAFAQVLEGRGREISAILTSFNGERYWTRELGAALMRHRPMLAEEIALEHPVQGFGDLGAATGASLLALAVEALRGKRAPGGVLAYASSDDGARAVVAIEEEN